MKFILILIITVSCSFYQLSGQNKKVDNTFSSLKSTLEKRSKAVLNLVEYIKKFKEVDTTLFQNVRNESDDLRTFVISSNRVDSKTIKAIYEKDSHLKQTLGRVLITLENYPNLRKDEGYMHVMLQLLDLEKMLKTAGENYNKQCLKYGHEELLFRKGT